MFTFARRLLFAVAAFAGLAASADFANAQAKPSKPTPVLQQEFDAFMKTFRAAMKANDAAAVTAMTRLPFYFRDAKREAAEFRASAYPQYFTARNRACIQRGKGVYDRDGENNDNFFIFCGQLIFVFTKTPTGFLFTEVGIND